MPTLSKRPRLWRGPDHSPRLLAVLLIGAAAATGVWLLTQSVGAEPRGSARVKPVLHPEVLPTPPPRRPPPPPAPLGSGKGMWIWQAEYTEGGDPAAVVARARAAGLSHLYVRTGSSKRGLDGMAFVDALLPVAHAAGLRVYGWDFPTFADINADLGRAAAAIGHVAADGSRLDGFAPDVETASEGTYLSHEAVALYSVGLRNLVGHGYPLIAVVPNPTPHNVSFFPYDTLLGPFDAVAPMVYWLNRQPDSDVATAVDWLAQFGKPVLPIGQAYDGGPEGGRPGPPTHDEITRFITAAAAHNAGGLSFWSWQHVSDEIWAAVAIAPPVGVPIAPG